MMSTPNFRSNTDATRRAILTHRSRTESDSIRALQESINFHRSLLYLRPHEFSGVSSVSVSSHRLPPDQQLKTATGTETDEFMRQGGDDFIRKVLIKQLRDELADLKRRVAEKNKLEKAKIRSDVVKSKMDPLEPTTNSPLTSKIKQPGFLPLLNSFFEILTLSNQGSGLNSTAIFNEDEISEQIP